MILTNMHFGWDVGIVEFLNNFTQNAHLEILFKLISYLGTEYLVIALFALLYWGLDKKMAKEMGYAAFYGMVTNNIFKSFFNFLRPFQERPDTIKCLDESILAKNVDGEYYLDPTNTYYVSSSSSFPSGHSQGSSGLFNSLAKSLRRRWVWIPATILCLLVMLSRMALGVHSFIDVLTGYLVGFAVVELVYFAQSRIKKIMLFHIIVVSVFGVITFLSPIWSQQTRDLFTTFGCTVGFVIGFYIEDKYIKFDNTKTWWKIVLRVAIGVALVLGIKSVLKLPYKNFVQEGSYLGNVLDMIRYFLMMMFATTLYPFIFKKIPFLNDKKEEPKEEAQEA